jgi:hypothetical protein
VRVVVVVSVVAAHPPSMIATRPKKVRAISLFFIAINTDQAGKADGLILDAVLF